MYDRSESDETSFTIASISGSLWTIVWAEPIVVIRSDTVKKIFLMHLRYGRRGIGNDESVESFPRYTTNKKASGFAFMLSHTY